MDNLSSGRSRFALRLTAIASLGLLVASSAPGCAQALGIEDTTLGPQGPVVDPCYEEIVPYLWYFGNGIAKDEAYPLQVVPRSTFSGLLSQFGQQPDDTRGHIVADARDCVSLDLGGGATTPRPAPGVAFRFQPPPGSTGVDASGYVSSNFFFDDDGSPNPGRKETSTKAPLGGILNSPPGRGTVEATASDFGFDGNVTAARLISVRPGFLSTIRLEPTRGLSGPAEPLPPDNRWACVGNLGPVTPSTSESVTFSANVVPFTDPTKGVGGIRFKVCGKNETTCDLGDNEPGIAVSDASGQARITVPTPTASGGVFDGYIVVRGKVPTNATGCTY